MHSNPSRMARVRRAVTSTASDASSSSTATAIVDNNNAGVASTVNMPAVPTSTAALAACVAVLAAIIIIGLGFCIWRRRRNARNQQNVHNINFSTGQTKPFERESKLEMDAYNQGLTRPEPVFIAGIPGADTNTSWVPQILPNRGNNNSDLNSTSPKKSNSKKSSKSLRSSRGWDKTFSKFAPSERSPPPSYMANGSPSRIASGIPLPPSPPHEAAIPPTPPTPPAKKAAMTLNPISAMLHADAPPIPSPLRSASFAAQQTTYSPSSSPEARMMNVINSFVPTLDDELPIQLGETVSMLEEYQDGWALVQRVGRPDAQKGVVPRSCLGERTTSYSPIRRL